MSYYFLYAPKKISSVLAYSLILFMLLGVGTFFMSRRVGFTSQASRIVQPQNILVSNVTDASFTVSFETKTKVPAFITYTTAKSLSTIRFDNRDATQPVPRTIHYFTTEQLSAASEYTVTINMNGQDYAQKILVNTLAKSTPTASYPPIFGKVFENNLQPATDVLITVSLHGRELNTPFTTLSKSTGEWIITMPVVVDKRLQPITLTDTDELSLTFSDGKIKKELISKYKDTSPAPSVVLSESAGGPTPQAVLGENTQSASSSNQLLIFPQNNTVVNSQYPLFRGISQPSSLVTFTLTPPGSTSVLSTNSYGEWKMVNTVPLLPGRYYITVTDATQHTAEASFLIGKSGESVLGDATNSATLTPTTTPSPTASLSPSPSISTPSPTLVISVTPSVVPTMAVPTPTVVLQRLPSAGMSNTFAIVAASASCLLGLLLLLY